jgi:hypothetical protein
MKSLILVHRRRSAPRGERLQLAGDAPTVTVKRARAARSSLEIPHLAGPRLRLIAGHLRMVYHQFNGDLELADVCTCTVDRSEIHRVPDAPCRCCAIVGFTVRRSAACPIDEHRLAALDALK